MEENTRDIELMSKEELEKFVGTNLALIGKDIYSTLDGKFTVKHVSYVIVEGVKDPTKYWYGESPWQPGSCCEVVQRNFTNKDEARKWKDRSYQLYNYVTMWDIRMGKKSRKETVERRRLERMEALRK